ncbi:MAG: hypothetical protein ABIE74_12775 [Pseudomonadota bacterium]
MMKKLFKFDMILTEEEMCDREAEKQRLISLMKRAGRVVIYSLRRMGKTSLVDVCSRKIRGEVPNAFHLYVDLNEVESLSEVALRFHSHYEQALKEQIPMQRAKQLIASLMSKLKLKIPGGFELSMNKCPGEKSEAYLMSLFQELRDMASSYEISLIIDEFQGIAELSDVQALLRREIQKLNKSAVVLMGSNQRLLYKMFNDKSFPFFGFGEDIELHEIPLSEYLPYMNERFAMSDIHISKDVAEYMADRMNNIPNYINELGAWIVDTMNNVELTNEHIDVALEAATQSKRGRYHSVLYGYTANQKKFLKAVAKTGRLDSATGQQMQNLTELSATELSRANSDLENSPLISHDTDNRLFIIDPFLKSFIETL